ncbi:MAG TPA: ABC transporter permease [Silvibacterium sp.]|nr:ABC transporter permease [Silvibacterium sp.]
MRALRRFVARAANFMARRRNDERLREEMESHLALQTEENLRAGMPPAEARRQAVLKFGTIGAVRDDYQAEQGLPLVEELLADSRFALRMLRKSPGFSAIAILTMALGIGASTAIFSVVDATLLHPLPYPQPEGLVKVVDDLPGIGSRDVGLSVPEWRDMQRSGIFSYVSLIGGGPINLTGSSQPERIQFLNVTPNYFALIGVKPKMGHGFNPEDQTPGFTLEALISDGLWKRSFGADPNIVGKNLRLDNDLYHVIGVMPAGFHDPGWTTEQRNTEIWLASGFAGPPAPPPLRSPRLRLEAIARLRPGLSIVGAQSRLDALVASLQRQYPEDYPAQSRWTVRLLPLKESIVGSVREPLTLLLAAVGLVLLIGCVNVAHLLLAHAAARAHEFAIRQAMGAARGRLTRQLLTESTILSFFGAATGFAILFCTRPLILLLIPESLPRLNDFSLNWGVLLFALGITVASGIVFGLIPAWQPRQLNLIHALRKEGRGAKGSAEKSATRRIFVVTEFALSLVLTIAAGLLLRSFWDLYKVRLGFNPRHVISVQTWLPIPNDPQTDPYRTAAQESLLLHEVLRRVRTLPGVEEAAVGSVSALPLGHGRNDAIPFAVIREGHEVPVNQAPVVDAATVSPEYFHLLDISTLQGRIFGDRDIGTTEQVAVINDAMARTYWPNENPVGRRIQLNPAKGTWAVVIGIVADARTDSLAEISVPKIYFSMYQRRAKDLAIFLRGELDAAAISKQVREQVQSVDPSLPVFGARTLDELIADSLSGRRFSMEIVASFAFTALLLAGLGIYGVISFAVGQRTHEIGIRLALGAQRASVLKAILAEGLALALTGAGIGVTAALIASRWMAGQLYGVRPCDPITFLAVAALLIGIALLACYIPARRATRINPLTALRHE